MTGLKQAKPRVAFTTSSRGNSGMVAAAVCEEDIDPVGFLLDTGPVKLTRRSQRAAVPRTRQVWMFACLAARFPNQFLPVVYRKFGLSTSDDYEKLRSIERNLVNGVLAQCGEGYRELLNPALRRFPTLHEVAVHYQAPFHEVANINSEESASLLESWRPDIIISLGDRIIKPRILGIPRLGILNGHSSLLPKYRGTTTEFWQLVNGETETGVTIHWMASRVDEGAIILQEKWPIAPGANHWELRAVSQFFRIPAWRKAIRLVIDGDPGRPQEHSDQPTFGMPNLEDLYTYYVLKRKPAVQGS